VTFASTLIGASFFFSLSFALARALGWNLIADRRGKVRRARVSSRPGEASQPYVLQTTFPTRELTDLSETIKQAGLLGSVVVQRPT
jgi:hypothetical protein